jgi:hypothetical protein
MGRKKGEQIKRVFLGNAVIKKVVPDQVYRDRLTSSLQTARSSLSDAKRDLESLPPSNTTRIAQMGIHDQLATDITAEDTRGQNNPATAWTNMEPLVERAANLKTAAKRWVTSAKRSIADVDRRAKRLRQETTQMKLERRETQNDRAAERLQTHIAELEGRIEDTLAMAEVDPERAISLLDDLEVSAELLRGGTRAAMTYTPEGQRKASRQAMDAMFGSLASATRGKADNRLGKMLAAASTDPDQHGFTLKDQMKATLEVFDDRYALTADESPNAQRDNTAMRITAMAGAMALRLVKQEDINDPLLKPVVAQAIVREYGEELARAIAGKAAGEQDEKALEKQQQEARRALALAQALLAEDPVMKVFTGKITGPDAVESIRRQAKAAGIVPSRMFEMQRQQLEMRVGALTMQQVSGGALDPDEAIVFNDKGQMTGQDKKPVDDPDLAARAQQQFILNDLYGELSPADMQRLVGYRSEKPATELSPQPTSPQFDDAGLVQQSAARQAHSVKAGDTLSSVARLYCETGADAPVIQAKVEEIKRLNKYVFWNEQVRQDDANQDAKAVLRGKVPVGERRAQEKIEKFLPDKPLPVGAVLTLGGTSPVLDQLAEYVAAWDTEPQSVGPTQREKLEPNVSKASTTIQPGVAEMQEPEARGKAESKVKPAALETAAKRLLPPIRPDLLNRLKALAAEIAKLSAEQRKSSPLVKEFDDLKKKLESFRDLAQSLSTQLETQARAKVEASDEFRKFENLKLELADPGFRQAPGLGQDHGRGGTLDDARAQTRDTAIQEAQRTQARIKELTTALKSMKEDVDKKKTPEYLELARLVAEQERAREAERSQGRTGAMNEAQYAHLKLLDRWDQEEKERLLAENGKTVEEYVTGKIAELLKVDVSAAKGMLDTAFRNVRTVPLTITFRAESLFSDSTKDEPAHGPAYVSEVVYSRKDVDMEDLIGRDDNAKATVAVTGGYKTQKDKDDKEVDANWVAGRGKNYMRWRTDKDDREARQDRLPFKDQQIFGAVNPNWEKTKGAVFAQSEKPDGKIDPSASVPIGTNYYGNAHFLLKDSVRTRVAYVVRGQNSNGGGKTAFQRKDFLMLFHDMIKGWDTNQRYLKALLTIGANDYVNTSNAWEFHLYGGFDIRHDAQEIYLADVVDPEARGRIERFAAKHGLKVVTDKIKGASVLHDGSVSNTEV